MSDVVNQLVNTTELGEILGLSTGRVSQMKSEGIFTQVDKPPKFVLGDAVKAYIDFVRDSTRGRTQEEASDEQRKLKADADFKRAKADQEQLRLAELEGHMHSAEDVEACTLELVHAVRSSLLALPGRVAVDAAAARSAPEVSAIVQREVEGVLTGLSEFQYDPAKYAEMVRDREGWRSTDGSDEEAEDS